MANKITVVVKHRSSIANAVWVEPKGWEPANFIEGADFIDGGWWSEEENKAGLVAWNLDDAEEGDEVEVELSDLRVASCGDCRVIAEVEV